MDGAYLVEHGGRRLLNLTHHDLRKMDRDNILTCLKVRHAHLCLTQ